MFYYKVPKDPCIWILLYETTFCRNKMDVNDSNSILLISSTH